MVAGHLTLKNGKYYAVIGYTGLDGKRVTKWIYTGYKEKGGKKKAEEALYKIRCEYAKPVSADDLSGDMLFDDYLLNWIEIAKARITPSTYYSYKNSIKNIINPYFHPKSLKLSEVQARHLQQFYTYKLETVKPATVIHYHGILQSALQYAFKMDLVLQNVARKVDKPKLNDFEPVFLSAEEMEKIFEALKGNKLELPVMLAAFYGMRRGEVLGLKWDAIDFKRNTISIRRTVTSVVIDGKHVDIESDTPKSKSSIRTLPLVDRFKEYFVEMRQMQEYNKKICGNSYNYDYDGYVFVDEMGNRMSTRCLSVGFPNFLKKNGFKKMRFHDLRHSCASLLLYNGVSIKQIQEWLGHADFSTTANIYAHLDSSAKMFSAKALEEGLKLPEDIELRSGWAGA